VSIKHTTLIAAALAGGSLLVSCAETSKSAASEQTVAAHVARAAALADEDLKALMRLCAPPPPRMSEEEGERFIAGQIARTPPAPAAAFDNLYFVGGAWSSAWALKTSEGIILIDALNNPPEAEALIETGLRKLGLDPAQIRYIVVSHGHGDHYGGAQYLAEKYKSRVVMSEADWRMVATGLEFTSRQWPAPPARDIAVKPGESLTLGDTTIVFQATPGHTWGTLSPVFPVRSGGKTHRAMFGAARRSTSARTCPGSTPTSNRPSAWRRWRSPKASTSCCQTTRRSTARSRSSPRCGRPRRAAIRSSSARTPSSEPSA
jgi:metallo-beta-lactamase class B